MFVFVGPSALLGKGQAFHYLHDLHEQKRRLYIMPDAVGDAVRGDGVYTCTVQGKLERTLLCTLNVWVSTLGIAHWSMTYFLRTLVLFALALGLCLSS